MLPTKRTMCLYLEMSLMIGFWWNRTDLVFKHLEGPGQGNDNHSPSDEIKRIKWCLWGQFLDQRENQHYHMPKILANTVYAYAFLNVHVMECKWIIPILNSISVYIYWVLATRCSTCPTVCYVWTSMHQLSILNLSMSLLYLLLTRAIPHCKQVLVLWIPVMRKFM